MAKLKKIPTEYLVICLDRLTRFKHINEKYKRVFGDILNKFLIGEQPTDILEITEIATEIINNSIPQAVKNDFYINNLINDFENRAFCTDADSKVFLNNKINYAAIFSELTRLGLCENLVDNLKWLNVQNSNRGLNNGQLRAQFDVKFPVEKVLLCEGATEEILLPTLAKICGYDFIKNGIFLLGAGGKNQVGRKYLQMLDEINLPVFILLDLDAREIEKAILPKLRKNDFIYLIENGEFEDILPPGLIVEAINYQWENGHKCLVSDLLGEGKMSKKLETLFRLKGFGDFKKSEFANCIKNYLICKNVNAGNFNFSSVQPIIENLGLDN